MVQTLLERFDIEVPEDFDSCNLIGVDFGDGELSAAIIRWDSVKEDLKLSDLMLDGGNTLRKNANAFEVTPQIQRLVYDARETAFSGARYYNFKKCPGTPECDSNYVHDDGTPTDKSYAEVMATGVNIAVRTLFEYNPLLIDRDKPTIILVGRPSSPGWAYSERAYAKLLQDGLSLDDMTQQPVRVAVQAESWAALAREFSRNPIKKGEVVVVLDNGSSTFDVTVISRNGLADGGTGEDSFQFGGNQLDDNLKKIWKKRLDDEGKKPLVSHGHKLGIRIKKEEYHGLDGELREPTLYSFSLSGPSVKDGPPQKYRFVIDDEIMDQALNQMPVTAVHFEGSLGSMIQKRPIRCKSWLDACRAVYREFYEEMQPLFHTDGDKDHPKVPDRVILSGGVSVMPELRGESGPGGAKGIVEEVFGVKPVLSDLPNYCVSQGLAYVLGCEVQKAKYLRSLQAEVKELLPDAESLRDSIASAGAELCWAVMRKSMEQWANDLEPLSIKDWNNCFYIPLFEEEAAYALENVVGDGANQWYAAKEMDEKISKLLKTKFDEMFPEYADDFHYSPPEPDFKSLRGVKVTITTDWQFFFGQMTSGEEPDHICSKGSQQRKRDQPWRKQAYQNFIELKSKVRNGGTVRYYYTSTVTKGFFVKRQEQVRKPIDIKYPGFKAMFLKEITTEVAEGIREEVYQMIAEDMKKYVELITPYFNMQARDNDDEAAP